MHCRVLILLLLSFLTVEARAENWLSWRGPDGSGIGSGNDFPTTWSPTENVKWRMELPEAGNSSPIVWDDRVFITQPVSKQNKRMLMCLDRNSGKLMWEAGTSYDEKDPTHKTNPYCSPSPVTDGQRVIAWYGSAGVYCYDLEGKEQWHRDLGPVAHIWGSGSSPVLHGDLCFLNFGPGDPSFVVALDVKTGQTVWQIDLPHKRADDGPTGLGESGTAREDFLFGSWATPLVIEAAGREELILAIPGRVLAVEPSTGKELWRCEGLADLVYASPVYGEGVIVALGGYHGPSLAVEPSGQGDVTAERRLWHQPRSKLRLGTGVIRDGHLYASDMKSIAECIELRTGKTVWEKRLAGVSGKNDTWSSMILLGDNVYLVNQSGDTIVFKAQTEFEPVATNSVGEASNSSLAASDGQIFLRTHDALWCFESEAGTQP